MHVDSSACWSSKKNTGRSTGEVRPPRLHPDIGSNMEDQLNQGNSCGIEKSEHRKASLRSPRPEESHQDLCQRIEEPVLIREVGVRRFELKSPPSGRAAVQQETTIRPRSGKAAAENRGSGVLKACAFFASCS